LANRQAVRGEKRREDILEAARIVFLEHGYSGASIDAVVARAGGSKETVYGYFSSKEGLLRALVERAAANLAAKLDQPMEHADAERGLLEIGLAYLGHILAPEALGVYRLVLSESGRKPELGDLFYRSCPEVFLERVAQYFSKIARDGLSLPSDARETAAIFVSMLRGDLLMRALFNPTRAPTANEIERHVRFVVASLLKICDRAISA
jgi:TetR/AcrR family transcriptional repressor of mexJK operon